MGKKAISLTMGVDNLLWARGQAVHRGGSLSAVVDALVSDARAGRLGARLPARSVVGTIDLAADDPALKNADATIRDLFARSLTRPSIARESGPKNGSKTPRRRTRG